MKGKHPEIEVQGGGGNKRRTKRKKRNNSRKWLAF
jgi:hypothetical protein